MKKQLTILLILNFFLFPFVGSAKIDDTHVRSVVQIFIYDNTSQEYVSSGSGVSVGGTAILTNYHVAEDVIKYPNDYTAIICFTKNSQSVSECNYMASPYYRFGMFKTTAEYQEDLDLALLYINYKKDSSGTWKSIANLPISEYDFDGVNPALYGYEMIGVQLGNEIQTLGFPDYGNDTMTYSNGVISNFWMDDEVFFEGHNGVLAIGTNAKIAPGSSGGAAFDKDGKFLGVTSAGIEDDNGNFLTGVIIPITTFNWWWEKVLGNKISDWFGYTTGTIPEDVGKRAICLLDGKIYNKSLDQCVYDYDFVCKNDYGTNSYYAGKITDKNETICGCLAGYIWEGRSCVSIEKPKQFCKVNTFYFPSASALASDTRRMYGAKKDDECECPNGYVWQNNMCILNKATSTKSEDVVAEEKALITKIDNTLSKKISGKILLQVEKNGEGWYVSPKDNKKYYLGRPEDAFEIMRKLGLGISEKDFNSYKEYAPRLLSGKILLRVEAKGEAYYIDHKDLKMHYLGRPADAFDVMRKLGLGITNDDIRKINIGEVE